MSCSKSSLSLVNGGDAADEGVWQDRPSQHVEWWEPSFGAVVRRSSRRFHELTPVSLAVEKSWMIRLVQACMNGLTSSRISDQTKSVQVVAKRSSVRPDYLASTEAFLEDNL